MGCKWADIQKEKAERGEEPSEAPTWCDCGACNGCGYYYEEGGTAE